MRLNSNKFIFTEEEVIKFVADNAAPYKQLVGGVEFLEAIPKSNSGKILRKEKGSWSQEPLLQAD